MLPRWLSASMLRQRPTRALRTSMKARRFLLETLEDRVVPAFPVAHSVTFDVPALQTATIKLLDASNPFPQQTTISSVTQPADAALTSNGDGRSCWQIRRTFCPRSKPH